MLFGKSCHFKYYLNTSLPKKGEMCRNEKICNFYKVQNTRTQQKNTVYSEREVYRNLRTANYTVQHIANKDTILPTRINNRLHDWKTADQGKLDTLRTQQHKPRPLQHVS